MFKLFYNILICRNKRKKIRFHLKNLKENPSGYIQIKTKPMFKIKQIHIINHLKSLKLETYLHKNINKEILQKQF